MKLSYTRGMGPSRIAIAWIAAGLAVFAAPAAAQPDEEIDMAPDSGAAKPAPPVAPAGVKDAKAAKKLHVTGQQLALKADYLVKQKKPDEAKPQYEAALAALTKAVEIGDDLNVYFDLAIVEDKLGQLERAANHLRVVIKAQAGVRPDVLRKATARFDDLATKLGLVTFVIVPEGATISLGEVAVATTPLTEPLILAPGTHTFSLSADGFQPKQLVLNVEAGSESERTVELSPIKIIVEQVKPRGPDAVEKPLLLVRPPSKLPLYVGGGLTLAFAGVATVTGILAIGQHGTFTAADSSNGERTDAKDNGQRLATITDAAVIGAVVAGGFTAYWYLFKYKPARKRIDAGEHQPKGRMDMTQRNRPRLVPDAAKVTVVPWVQAGVDVGGLSIAGRF